MPRGALAKIGGADEGTAALAQPDAQAATRTMLQQLGTLMRAHVV